MSDLKSVNRKYKRQFKLQIETDVVGEYIEVKTPITVEFSVERSHMARENTATFTIYNLDSEKRDSIYKANWDRYTIRRIEFFAGYEEMDDGMLPRVFKGTIRECYSVRSGSDFKTVIDAFDSLWSLPTVQVNLSIDKGQTYYTAIKRVAQSITGVDWIVIGRNFTDTIKRGLSLMGHPFDVLSSLTKDSFYVDSGVIYALSNDEVVIGNINEINPDNGLLGTPRFIDMKIEIDMIFEPRLKPSQLLTLESESNDRFNGDYKVTGFKHSGVISDAVSGDCKTHITMMKIEPGGYALGVQKVTGVYLNE